MKTIKEKITRNNILDELLTSHCGIAPLQRGDKEIELFISLEEVLNIIFSISDGVEIEEMTNKIFRLFPMYKNKIKKEIKKHYERN